MSNPIEKRPPELVFREGKPVAVILDIDQYKEILEQLEDIEDLKMLEEMKQQNIGFKKLDDFLSEYQPSNV